MKRRDFLRLGAMGGAAVAVGGCGKAGTQLIRFVPEETLIPGVAVWKHSVCTQCPAGCGLQVRVMEGDAEVVRNGQFGIVKMGLAKKLEGNPQHPVNHGKLCAWGQAGLQVTYNPDRIKHPLKRVGQRGAGEFAQISWDEALKELTTHLAPLSAQGSSQSVAFLTKRLRGQRRELIGRFLSGFENAQLAEFELFDDSVLRKANSLSFGYDQLPTFDLARSNYVISFGADFLGTWNSPVAQAFAYGDMRQGRPGNRGKFVQVEPRMSQTGGNSDEWVPIRPGTEGDLALGFAHVILNDHLVSPAQAGTAGAQIEGWREGLADYSPAAVAWRTGVAPDVITRLAHEMAAHTPALAIVGGAPLAQTNGLLTALAVNALNALLGSVMKPGGILFTPQPSLGSTRSATKSHGINEAASVQALAQQILSSKPRPVGAVLLYDTNPVFAAAPQWQVREALEGAPYITSFGSFLDETSSLADLILPDHSTLESWADHIPESGSAQAAVSVAPPSMLPLYDTRSMPDVLIDLAHRLGGKTAAAFPWKTYEDALKEAVAPLRRAPGSIHADNDDDFWAKVKEQGGWWSSDQSTVEKPRALAGATAIKRQDAQFDGATSSFPFHFLPYASQQFFDGTHANLPWMQEMPDVLTSAMWSTWLEINPETATRLGISQGDLLEIASEHGKIQAPALLFPGISPDVMAMPVGQGHEDYGRYATGRGANPLKIVGPQVEPHTSSWAWASTRVSITKVGSGELILFSGGPTEWSETVRR